jgi:hypothetical protein
MDRRRRSVDHKFLAQINTMLWFKNRARLVRLNIGPLLFCMKLRPFLHRLLVFLRLLCFGCYRFGLWRSSICGFRFRGGSGLVCLCRIRLRGTNSDGKSAVSTENRIPEPPREAKA